MYYIHRYTCGCKTYIYKFHQLEEKKFKTTTLTIRSKQTQWKIAMRTDGILIKLGILNEGNILYIKNFMLIFLLLEMNRLHFYAIISSDAQNQPWSWSLGFWSCKNARPRQCVHLQDQDQYQYTCYEYNCMHRYKRHLCCAIILPLSSSPPPFFKVNHPFFFSLLIFLEEHKL